ncbi:hypothetical protein DIPPA_04606 [Diplonema papillatum]|nr:hypothetical protein DIPPA_04606 [Diplonema papillatum]
MLISLTQELRTDIWEGLAAAVEEAKSKRIKLGSKASSEGSPVADIAVIGLAVMGQNLILNMADNVPFYYPTPSSNDQPATLNHRPFTS